jgi:hypothetical protein
LELPELGDRRVSRDPFMLIRRASEADPMRFVVTERVKGGGIADMDEFGKIAVAELKYKRDLERKGKIAGGPCLDILASAYILETKTIEEMGEIFFNSPANFVVEREVHPLGTFADSLEGMKERD